MQTPPVITPISLTGATYTQNFNTGNPDGGLSNVDGLMTPTPVPVGWGFAESGSAARAIDGRYTVSNGTTGSGNEGDTYSYGTTGQVDRAFGSLATGTITTRVGAVFLNSIPDSNLSSLTISYTGEQWRQGTSTDDVLRFQYRVGATDLSDSPLWIAFTPLDFVAPIGSLSGPALDGNDSANRTSKVGTITLGTPIAPNQTFAIRFVDSDSTGTDDGLAIDDFSLSAQAEPVPEPATVFAGIALLGVIAFRERRRLGTLLGRSGRR